MTAEHAVPAATSGEPPAAPGAVSPIHRPAVRVLIVSRAATTLGMATLSYGAMVFLAQEGATQFIVSLAGATRYLAAVIFGLQGGIVADSVPKRTALVFGYAAQAALCFIVPIFFGTQLPALLLLLFAVGMLGQIIAPATKASVALVASGVELASVAAILSVASGLGAAVGSSFLAPLLITLGGIRLVMFAAGAVMLLGAIRTAKLPDEVGGDSIQHALRNIDWKGSLPNFRTTAQWILANRTIATMTLVGASVVALFDGLNSLMPVYVRDVLGVDPAATVYIFAPGAIGFLVGTVAGPWLMNRFGERPLAAVALVSITVGAVLFGFVDQVAPVLAPISPLRVLELFGFSLSQGILAAGFIAIPFSFGSTAAGAAVQTFLNRRVPLATQGSVFGMQELLENLLTLIAILALGVIATLIGPRFVFVVAPPLVIAGIVWLIRESYRRAQLAAPSRHEVVDSMLRPSSRSSPEATTDTPGQASDPEQR